MKGKTIGQEQHLGAGPWHLQHTTQAQTRQNVQHETAVRDAIRSGVSTAAHADMRCGQGSHHACLEKEHQQC